MKFQDAIKHSVELFSNKEFIERIKLEDPSMIDNIPFLKKMNHNGFLTIESQAGRNYSITSDSKTQVTKVLERAYVLGFMPEKKAENFIEKIALYSDKNATYIPSCDDSVYIPAKLDIPLTIVKKNGEVPNVHTHSSTVLPESVWNSYRKQLKINKNEKVVFIMCWDTKWGRKASSKSGLFTDILRILDK